MNDYEKLIVTVLSLEGESFNCNRGLEECEPFCDWTDFKIRMLERFPVSQQGNILGQFLVVR